MPTEKWWRPAAPLFAGVLVALSWASTSQAACTLSDSAVLPAGNALLDSDGHPLARFGGQQVRMTASNLPKQARGLVTVRIGGSKDFQLDGFLRGTSLPLYTSRRLAVREGHVWLEAERPVRFAGVASDKLRVTYSTKEFRDPITLSAPCDGLKMNSTPTGVEPYVSPAGTGYVLQSDRLRLFADPTAKAPLIDLGRGGPGALFFWSQGEQGTRHHVTRTRDLIFDGWVASDELQALPPGEMADEAPSSPVENPSSRFAAPKDATLVRALRTVEVRGRANVRAPVLGRLLPGSESYVVDIVAGWASVLPRSMAIVPTEGNQFWVRAEELGL